MKNVISQSLGLHLININVYATVYQNIQLNLKDRAISTFLRIWRSAKLRPMINVNIAIPWARSCQYQCICKILSKYFKRFSEFEHRQNLDQSQLSFDYFMGFIVSISMCMQNFIILFRSVQEIWQFSLFQNFELGKASSDEKCHFAISWARSR